MASPASGRSSLHPGDLLAGRYRLLHVASARREPAIVWQASDEILARPVAVKVLPTVGRSRGAAQRFLVAAGRASALSHPVLARVYDAAVEERPGTRSGRTVDLPYVISEWVDGRPLADVLRLDGPMAPGEAVRLVQDAAGAVAAAHRAGVSHGRLHPGNVLIAPGGRLRITDAAVSAALHDDDPLDVCRDGPLAGPEIARDVRDLAALLYAMLTACWPTAATPQPAAGVAPAPAPASGALVYPPRQVRAGVPRALDAVVVRALDPAREPSRKPLTTPQSLAEALDGAGPDGRAGTPPPHAGTSRRRRAWPLLTRFLSRAVTLAVIVAIGVTCYALGKRVGQLPRRPGTLEALSVPSTGRTAAQPPELRRIDLRAQPVMISDYDPFGTGSESPGSVTKAFDGDPLTSWTTASYRTSRFDGRKPGVGLLVDLGRPTDVASVGVSLVDAGAGVELRSANELGDNADSFTTVAAVPATDRQTTLIPTSPTTARYWLIWFTALPRSPDGRYRDGVAELTFTRSAA